MRGITIYETRKIDPENVNQEQRLSIKQNRNSLYISAHVLSLTIN